MPFRVQYYRDPIFKQCKKIFLLKIFKGPPSCFKMMGALGSFPNPNLRRLRHCSGAQFLNLEVPFRIKFFACNSVQDNHPMLVNGSLEVEFSYLHNEIKCS